MATISKEEREEWKALAQECVAGNIACYPTTPEEFLALLDTLEASEARAEKAERERSVLANLLVGYLDNLSIQVGFCEYCPAKCSENDCLSDLLEWAAQEAEKEGGK